MFVVRPVSIEDVAALEALAAVATPGVHTLPKSRAKIERAVEHSLASFAAQVDLPSSAETVSSDEQAASRLP